MAKKKLKKFVRKQTKDEAFAEVQAFREWHKDWMIRVQKQANALHEILTERGPDVNGAVRLRKKPAEFHLKSWTLVFNPPCPVCKSGLLTPIAVMDGEEVYFGYECQREKMCGEYFDQGDRVPEIPWPFKEAYVWTDDLERLGFTVRVA